MLNQDMDTPWFEEKEGSNTEMLIRMKFRKWERGWIMF